MHRLRPWWERWPGWWSQQQRVVNRRWGYADGYKVHIEAHTIFWTGSVKLRKDGVKKMVPLTIIWGPATPFFPPRIGSQKCLSAFHQLSDGSMCLLPPIDPIRGWEGLVDIGFWLDKAEEWMVLFFKENWSVEPAIWQMSRHLLPGYRYRRVPPDVQVVALPGEWQDMPPGLGDVRVCLPKGRKGIGAVVAWEDHSGSWRDWDAGNALVREPREEVFGFWAKLRRSPFQPGEMDKQDEDLLSRSFLRNARSLQEALFKGRNRVSLFGSPMVPGNGAVPVWAFHHRAPPGFVPGAMPILQALAMVGLPLQEGVGIPFKANTLDIRRRAGRSQEMHDALKSPQIVLVGLGSLGSEIAHLLAQEGVRRFYLVDGDVMLPGNEARHRAGLCDAGRPKVEAVEGLIRGIQPEAEVLLHHGWLDDLMPQLGAGTDDGASIFVGATGDEATEHFLSDVAHDIGDTAIHAWLELDGTIVRVVRYVPGLDPTLSAVANMAETPRLIAPDDPMAPRICAETVLPGSALNLHAAANFVVRIVLDEIAGKRDGPNHWFFAPGGTDAPDAQEVLKKPYGVLAMTLPA